MCDRSASISGDASFESHPDAPTGPDGLIEPPPLAEEGWEILRHSAITEHIAEGVHIIRADDGRFVYVNPAFARMLGYAADELIGRHVNIINAPDDRSPEETAREIIACLNRDGAWRGEILNLRKDGTRFWCSATVSTFQHPTFGRVWLSIHEDITSRKQREIELVAAKHAAQAANRAKGAFLSRMSHEIRTPLNAVIGAAELLEDEPVSPQGRQFLEMLRQGGAILLTLVNNILELSAIESGEIASTQEECDPRELLAGLVASLEPLALKKGLSLLFAVDRSVPTLLLADVVHLRLVLVNLLGNAIKFTQAGVVLARAAMAGPTHLSLVVSDTGPGIPPELQSIIFDPYRSRSDTPVEGQGSGLGLSICKAFVELMGGALRLDSSNRGTQFTFSIPVGSLRAAEAPSPDPVGYLAGKRVLIAEDDPFSARILRALLLKLGAKDVSVARNGQEAVELARGADFQLMLCDKHMPVMDGLAAIRTIRAEAAAAGRPPCRIVAVTADAFADDRRLCIEAGCDRFLSKPISQKALLKVFEELAEVELALDPTRRTPCAP